MHRPPLHAPAFLFFLHPFSISFSPHGASLLVNSKGPFSYHQKTIGGNLISPLLFSESSIKHSFMSFAPFFFLFKLVFDFLHHYFLEIWPFLSSLSFYSVYIPVKLLICLILILSCHFLVYFHFLSYIVRQPWMESTCAISRVDPPLCNINRNQQIPISLPFLFFLFFFFFPFSFYFDISIAFSHYRWSHWKATPPGIKLFMATLDIPNVQHRWRNRGTQIWSVEAVI